MAFPSTGTVPLPLPIQAGSPGTGFSLTADDTNSAVAVKSNVNIYGLGPLSTSVPVPNGDTINVEFDTPTDLGQYLWSSGTDWQIVPAVGSTATYLGLDALQDILHGACSGCSAFGYKALAAMNLPLLKLQLLR